LCRATSHRREPFLTDTVSADTLSTDRGKKKIAVQGVHNP